MKFNHQTNNSFDYKAYYSLIENLVESKQTTGSNQSEALVDFTSLNLRRMKRLNKTFTPSESSINKLNQIDTPQRWVVISEGWCGDAAQIVPIIASLASHSKNINLEIILRDENLEIIDNFLTNGGRSIPMVIAIGEDDEILFRWGPRPAAGQAILAEHKRDPETYNPNDFKLALHTWYAKNKGLDVQNEILALL